MPRHGETRRAGRQVIGTSETGLRSRLESKAFEEYYRAQLERHAPKGQCARIVEKLREPLPVVIRLNPQKRKVNELREAFAADDRWTNLPWFPDGLAWSCDPKNFDAKLQKQINALNKSYALRFQEAASLVPVLFLNLVSNQPLSVLDMCAAPGSKTLQVIEQIAPSSIVVANDADPQRCMELLPLMLRKTRHAGTAVTLSSAAKYPAVITEDGPFLFDRIVCDVPCSGDGTLRKNPEGWKNWTTSFANSLHAKQLSILCHGLHLLKPGGTLVYSTCSMNPVENEAVVFAALKKYQGTVQICRELHPQRQDGRERQDVAHAASGMKAHGFELAEWMTEWKVGHEGGLYSSWDEVPEELRKPTGPLCETMFRPSESALPVFDDASKYAKGTQAFAPKLGFNDACFRLWPEANDSSGFFVTVLKKVRHWGEQDAAVPVAKDIPWRGRNDNNEYEVIPKDSDLVSSLAAFYGVEDMPSPLVAEKNIKGQVRQLVHVNDTLLSMLQCKMATKKPPILLSIGVPLFKLLDDNFMTEIDLKCRWRPHLCGCSLLATKAAARKITVTHEVMLDWLERRHIPMAEMLEKVDAQSLASLEDKLGGCILGLSQTPDGSAADDFWLPCVLNGQFLDIYANADEAGTPIGDSITLAPPLQSAQMRRLDIAGTQALPCFCYHKPAGFTTEECLKLANESSKENANPVSNLVSVNRLDRDVSGIVMFVQKDLERDFIGKFTEQKVFKAYLCVVVGKPGEYDEFCGQIDAPIWLAPEHRGDARGGASRYKVEVGEHLREDPSKSGLWEAVTLWRVIEVFTCHVTGRRLSLLSVCIPTGRTHQIRAHLAHAGCPLVGDGKYGTLPGQSVADKTLFCAAKVAPRILLHCDQMALTIDGQRIQVECRISEDMSVVAEKMGLGQKYFANPYVWDNAPGL